MKNVIGYLKGDKVIWSVVALLALFSFMPVFSASSNLAFSAKGSGNTIGFLLTHMALLMTGFGLTLYIVNKIPYHYFKAFSVILMPLVIVLLIFTLLQGKLIEGANASRWVEIPFIGVSFQPSTAAFIVMMVYVSKYLASPKSEKFEFIYSIWKLWVPVFIIIGLVLIANFSTAALMFLMVLMLVYIGKYPLKYIASIVSAAIVFFILFITLAINFPAAFPNRVDTWISRVNSFSENKPGEDDYQIEKAKIAIATGGLTGLGPGKSVQRNFLPQSSSDFIFAIIVEENGMAGGLMLLCMYLFLAFRFVVAAKNAPTLFGKFLIVGLGFPIVFQALINMAVAVELFPVTGQTLPFISSGGTSIWMTCISIGIIISVTKKEEEIQQEEIEKQRKELALQKLIENQLQEELLAERTSMPTQNPLEEIKNK